MRRVLIEMFIHRFFKLTIAYMNRQSHVSCYSGSCTTESIAEATRSTLVEFSPEILIRPLSGRYMWCTVRSFWHWSGLRGKQLWRVNCHKKKKKKKKSERDITVHIRKKTFCCQDYIPISGGLFVLVLSRNRGKVGKYILQSLVKIFSIVE